MKNRRKWLWIEEKYAMELTLRIKEHDTFTLIYGLKKKRIIGCKTKNCL